MTSSMGKPLVSDEEIGDIFWNGNNRVERGRELVALVRKRLADRLREASTCEYAKHHDEYASAMRDAIAIVED